MLEPPKRDRISNLFDRLLRGTPATAPAPRLHVTSHVARDLLQNAAYFNSAPKAVAEYVSNAIDNAPPRQSVLCTVKIARDEIRISDDASGMTYTELSNFFQMHGVNVQRSRGRAVRGKFGTGKSAAFGIANTLQIETVKEGKRNVVELRRPEVESAKDGQPIPVREIAANEATQAHSGTTIIVRDLNIKNIDANATRAYLEKLLGRHLRLHRITVNGTQCEFREPEYIKTFRFKPPRVVAEKIGSAACILKISKEPMGRDENTVAVLCNGFMHATTLAGKQSEPFVEFIFGEVEAPSLDEDSGPIPPFDNTRNLALNPQNPRVQVLTEWLGECIDEVRRELIERDKRRRYSKEMRLLHKVAGQIQSYLNDDFKVVQQAMPWATMPGARHRNKTKRKGVSFGKTAADAIQTPSLVERSRSLVNRLLGRPDEPHDASAALANIRRGGRVEFEINYLHLGANASRSRFIPDRRAIYLNRDHPQLRVAEAEAGIASQTFKMLSYDVAFTEYALAVVSQLADQGVEVADPIDASEMVQEILDRLGRKAAERFMAELATRQAGEVELELEGDDQVEQDGQAG